MHDEDWYDDDDFDDDEPEADEVVACSECGAEIYADAEQCPKCGYWLTEADRQAASPGWAKSKVVKIVAAVLLLIFLVSLLLYGTMF